MIENMQREQENYFLKINEMEAYLQKFDDY